MMLYEYLRFFKYDGATFEDLSLDNQEEAKQLVPTLTTSDYIYVAQYFPFNNLYFYLGSVANTASANFSAQYWDGRVWRDVVDILDATKVGDASLGRSGVIQWNLDRDYGWQRINDSDDNNAPSELQGNVRIYDSYWIRFKFDANLDAGLEIQEMTYTFTNDQELDNVDCEINNFLPAFASGKTDWIPEIITASKFLVVDLKRQGLVVDKNQVIRFDDVFIPATYKALDLIYMNLGPSYFERRNKLKEEYDKALNIRRFTLDANADGELSRNEITSTIKRLVR